jgi:hypothetical protein
MSIRSFKGEVLELSPEVRGLLDNGIDFLKKGSGRIRNFSNTFYC